MRIVFTGAPCTGKSSTLEEFKKQFEDHGWYRFKSEVAREWLTFFETHEDHKHPTGDRDFFQNFIETIAIKYWVDGNDVEIDTVYDRSMIDEVAYRNYFGMKIPNKFNESCKKYHYDKIFYFPLWSEIYLTDSIRTETIYEATKIDNNLRRAYHEYGYELIEVPFGTIEERVKFIYDNIIK